MSTTSVRFQKEQIDDDVTNIQNSGTDAKNDTRCNLLINHPFQAGFVLNVEIIQSSKQPRITVKGRIFGKSATFIVSRLDEMDQYLNDGHDGDIGYSIHIDCKEHLEIWIEFNLIFDDNDKLCVKSVQGRVPWSTEDIDAYNTKGRRKASTLPGFNWKLE